MIYSAANRHWVYFFELHFVYGGQPYEEAQCRVKAASAKARISSPLGWMTARHVLGKWECIDELRRGLFPGFTALVCMEIKRNEYNTPLFSIELYIQLTSAGRSAKSLTSFVVQDRRFGPQAPPEYSSR
jgi:hypothetical protein